MMVVYSRHTQAQNGSSTLHEDGAGGHGYFAQSGIRRSCSLDGVALASRCRGDDDVTYHCAGVGRTRSNSHDDWHSQGHSELVSCFLYFVQITVLFLGHHSLLGAVYFQVVCSLPCARLHPSYGDFLEVKRKYYQNCSVLDCVTQCSQSAAHLHVQSLQVTLGPLRCAYRGVA